MTAPAPIPRERGWDVSRKLRAATAALVGLVALCAPAPVTAQIGAVVSVFSDAQFRGYSLSGNRPVATLDLSYDHPSGAYASLSASAVADEGLRPFSLQIGGGYARQLASGTTLDLGIVHSAYRRYGNSRPDNSYTEVYAGIARSFLSSRLSFSPHYFHDGQWTLYGELNANAALSSKTRLNGHVGLLVPIRTPAYIDRARTEHDWRLGLTQELGRLSLHADVTGGGPGRDYYRGREHRRTRLVVGASYAL